MNALAIIAVAASTLVCSAALAKEDAISKDEYKSSAAQIKQDYSGDKAKCDSLAGNAKDVCRAEAKAHERLARSELDARRKPGVRADYEVAKARAEGAYDVAKEKCDDLAGNAKDVCIKEAKAAHTKAIADAKSARATAQAGMTTERSQGYVSESRQRGKEHAAEVKEESAQDVDDAKRNLAREKCDVYAGDAKQRCLENVDKKPARSVTQVK